MGPFHWMEACVVIAAACMQQARSLLHDWGKANKIDVSQFDIELAKTDEPGILFDDDGDY
jgi:hypothetical protein